MKISQDQTTSTSFNTINMKNLLSKKRAFTNNLTIAENLEINFGLLVESHKQKINLAALTRDSKFLVTTSENTIKVWCTVRSQAISNLSGHSLAVSCICTGRDLLVSASLDETIRIWDLNSMSSQYIIKTQGLLITCLDLDSSSSVLVSGSLTGQVALWDLQQIPDNSILTSHKSAVKSLIFSKFSQVLYSASADGEIVATNTLTRSRIHSVKTPDSEIFNVFLSLDEQFLVSCSAKSVEVRCWDLKTWKFASYALRNKDPTSKVVLSSDNKCFLYSTTGFSVVQHPVDPLEKPRNLYSHTAKISDIVQVDLTIFSVSYDRAVIRYSLEDCQARMFNHHTLPVTYYKVCPKAGLLLTCGRDKTIRIWNLDSGVQEKVVGVSSSYVIYVSVPDDFRVMICTCGMGDIIFLDCLENTEKKVRLDDLPRLASVSKSRSKKYMVFSALMQPVVYIHKMSILLF